MGLQGTGQQEAMQEPGTEKVRTRKQGRCSRSAGRPVGSQMGEGGHKEEPELKSDLSL